MTRSPRSRRLPPHIQQPSFLRRHRFLTLGFAFVVLLRLIPTQSKPPGSPSSPDDDYTRYHDQFVRVVYVVDGDTFDFLSPDTGAQRIRVRLWGVDTPEVAGPRTELMHWGENASGFAKSMLDGELVRLDLLPDRTRDRYDRLLVYATLVGKEESFNQTLVKLGHAYADTRFPHPHLDAFQKSEHQARQNALGLWEKITPQQMPRWRRRVEDRNDAKSTRGN